MADGGGNCLGANCAHLIFGGLHKPVAMWPSDVVDPTDRGLKRREELARMHAVTGIV
jgi:hypothetical protein